MASGFPDQMYSDAGATIITTQKDLYDKADVVLKVQPPTKSETDFVKKGSTLISFLYPLSNLETVQKSRAREVNAFAMDLMPSMFSRAQSMDALSSQVTVAGYKVVILAAESLPKLFPMLMTAVLARFRLPRSSSWARASQDCKRLLLLVDSVPW